MVRPTTTAQQELIDAIRTFTDGHGYPPTWKELAAMTGRQTSTIQGHMIRMRRKGLVAWDDSARRSLRVCADAQVSCLPLLAAQTGEVRAEMRLAEMLRGSGTFLAEAGDDCLDHGVRRGDLLEVFPCNSTAGDLVDGMLVVLRRGKGTVLAPLTPAERDNVIGVVSTVIRSLSGESDTCRALPSTSPR